MPEYLTIKQFADARGVSSAAVYKRISTSYQKYVEIVNGHIRLNKAIFDEFPPIAVDSDVDNEEKTIYNELIEALKAENAMLRAQLEVKDNQIASLASALASAQQSIQAEQALRASSVKRLPWWKKRKESE